MFNRLLVRQLAGMARGFDHERLRVFQLASDVYVECAALVRRLSPLHRHLRSQLLRASSSIPLNIAEGTAEVSKGEKARFYRMALRSAAECGAVLYLLTRCRAVDGDAADAIREKLRQIIAMLTALILRITGG
jgi:four helix bundle protein